MGIYEILVLGRDADKTVYRNRLYTDQWKTMETEEMKAFLKDNPSYRVAFDSLMKSNPKVQEHLAPTQQEFQLIFRDTSLRWAKGEITAQECVDSMAEQCNRALDEYNEANPVEE